MGRPHRSINRASRKCFRPARVIQRDVLNVGQHNDCVVASREEKWAGAVGGSGRLQIDLVQGRIFTKGGEVRSRLVSRWKISDFCPIIQHGLIVGGRRDPVRLKIRWLEPEEQPQAVIGLCRYIRQTRQQGQLHRFENARVSGLGPRVLAGLHESRHLARQAGLESDHYVRIELYAGRGDSLGEASVFVVRVVPLAYVDTGLRIEMQFASGSIKRKAGSNADLIVGGIELDVETPDHALTMQPRVVQARLSAMVGLLGFETVHPEYNSKRIAQCGKGMNGAGT